MLLFSTRNTQFLAEKMPFAHGRYDVQQLPDGELYVRIHDDVAHKQVCVIAATQPPAENFIELLLLLDALQRQQADIYLIITYFGYARQDQAAAGEALSAEVFSRCLQTFSLRKIVILQAHSPALHAFLHFENKIPFDVLYAVAQQQKVCLVAPDQGAAELVQHIAQQCDLEYAVAEKVRSTPHNVEITKLHGNVAGKNILVIDDMVATGNTMLHVISFLKQQGAKNISLFITHGVFAHGVLEQLEQNTNVQTIYVTNSVSQSQQIPKMVVLDIVPFLVASIRRLL